MRQFRDNQGRTWSIAASAGATRDVLANVQVHLADAFDGSLLERFAQDPQLVVRVLWVMCEAEADARGVDPEEFGRSLGGVLPAATRALLEELGTFAPARVRATFRKAIRDVGS